MSTPISFTKRSVQSMWPLRGVGNTSGVAATAPGTAVTLESLGMLRAELNTITPTAVNDFLYTADITFDGVTTHSEYQADASATVAEITAGLALDINTNQPAYSVVAVDGTTVLTLESEVRGTQFDVILSDNLSNVVTTANLEADSALVKIYLVNHGANIMYLMRDGAILLPMPGGALGWEWVSPTGSDFAVIGTAGQAFEVIVVEPFENQL